MRNYLWISLIMILFVLLTGVSFAGNDIKININAAKVFASLPDGVSLPEGITANTKSGEIYVSTFNSGGTNKLLRFSPNGKLLAQRDFGGTPLSGMAFNSIDGKVYIANFGASMIQRIPYGFKSSTTIENVAGIPSIGAPPNRIVKNPDGSQDEIIFGNSIPTPNGLVFSKDYDLFVSDSFQGAIFKIVNPGDDTLVHSAELVVHDSLLATAGFPPFGAVTKRANVIFIFLQGRVRPF